jgi:iron(III) transport system ATP-binding protein
MALLQLDQISKRYGATAAVRSLSLQMEQGEILSLLGPSGCGKTTVLRLIAGLETPDEGMILFDGVNIAALSPQKRRFGIVFQSYALFPHMNVFENVAFGLKARGVGKTEIAARVDRALQLVQLADKSTRKIQQLSGGEQQRVAVARAIVIEPRLLLLDEPLSNLDASLRESTRRQLRQLIKKLQISAIFVTHDQQEAFAVADRVSVLNFGVLQQSGLPADIYDHPANLFVSRFVGKSNVLHVQVRQGSNDFRVGESVWHASEPAAASGAAAAVFRPEQVRLGEAAENYALVQVVDLHRTVQGVTISSRLGDSLIEIQLPVADGDSIAARARIGGQIPIHVPPAGIRLLADD